LARSRGLLLALGITVAAVLLVATCWLGARGLGRTRRAAPAPEIVAAAPTFSPVDETPPASQPQEAAALPNEKTPDVPAIAEDDPEADEEQQPPVTAPAVAAKSPEPEKPARPRLKELSEEELRKQLAAMPEFGLSQKTRQALVQSYSNLYKGNSGVSMSLKFDPFTLLHHFPDAAVLPVRSTANCQLPPKEAATLGVLAKKLHAYLDTIAPMDQDGKRAKPTRLREVLREERRGKRPEWLRAEALPAMLQILMAEDVPLRLLLVDMIAEVDARPATIALAQRAVYDLSAEVRQAAIKALRDRPRADSRPVLVEALRYPWAPVADHAAQALVDLADGDAVPLLVNLLGKPDPVAPYPTAKDGTAVRHLVRVNHLANCLLCHAPAQSGKDPVVGFDPSVNITTSGSSGGGGRWRGRSSGASQSQAGGGGGGWRGGTGSMLIRADVQFLKQDFSVSFPVGIPGVEVQGLRFDYLIATRLLKGAELREWKEQSATVPSTYPQREAALFALRALTGKDVGPTTEAWVQQFPNANAEAEGVRLSAALLKAAPVKRDQLLARYRDEKDDGYTAGLARAIQHLPSNLQEKVREALVERLARLPVDRLRAALEDEDDEVCHAAALACVRKADKELEPDLIGLLMHSDQTVAEGAHKMLQRLTGQDFGPAANASEAERVAAASRWQTWWRSQESP
jgi:HEAT repeat protein